jgi:hypothetical protein
MLKQIVCESDDIQRATRHVETKREHHLLQIRRGAEQIVSFAEKVLEAPRRQTDLQSSDDRSTNEFRSAMKKHPAFETKGSGAGDAPPPRTSPSRSSTK